MINSKVEAYTYIHVDPLDGRVPWSKLACEMVDGAESDPESTHFERVVFLLAVGWRLDPFPVVFLEERVVEGIKRLPLVISHGGPEEAGRTVLPTVVHESHGPRTRIFGVLHNFLYPHRKENNLSFSVKKLCRKVKRTCTCTGASRGDREYESWVTDL